MDRHPTCWRAIKRNGNKGTVFRLNQADINGAYQWTVHRPRHTYSNKHTDVQNRDAVSKAHDLIVYLYTDTRNPRKTSPPSGPPTITLLGLPSVCDGMYAFLVRSGANEMRL